jgi:hypothetical protein
MAQITYGLTIIPDAYKADYNLIAAIYYGDPLTSQNLSRPLIPDDAPDPATATPTHWYGGLSVDEAWVSAFVNGLAPPAPANGWPLLDPNDGVTELLSEADALTAWAARDVTTRTLDGELSAVAAATKTAAFGGLGLAEPPPPEI